SCPARGHREGELRKRKSVLLLVEDETQLGQWRMRLDLWGWHVLAATNLLAAIDLANANPECYLAVTNVAGPSGAESIGTLALGIERVLLFGGPKVPKCPHAHRV